MSILLIGVNHKTAPVEIRERLALNDEACASGLRQLVDGDVVREGLIVSTCNRVEVLGVQAGTVGRVLNRLVHHTFKVAKRVRSETGNAASAMSINYKEVELGKK